MSVGQLPVIDFDRLFDLSASTAVRKAPLSYDAAAEALAIAAVYLRKHEPLPYVLAEYLADAFEETFKEVQGERTNKLAHKLNLKGNHKRKHQLDIPSAYAIIQKNFHLVDQSGYYLNVETPALVKLLMKEGKCGATHARLTLKEINQILKEELDDQNRMLPKSS